MSSFRVIFLGLFLSCPRPCPPFLPTGAPASVLQPPNPHPTPNPHSQGTLAELCHLARPTAYLTSVPNPYWHPGPAVPISAGATLSASHSPVNQVHSHPNPHSPIHQTPRTSPLPPPGQALPLLWFHLAHKLHSGNQGPE